MQTRTIFQWRSDGELIASAAKILNKPDFKEMVSVLEAANPANNPAQIKDGAGAMYEIGLIYGYRLALENLKSMGEPMPKAPEELKTSWGVTEE